MEKLGAIAGRMQGSTEVSTRSVGSLKKAEITQLDQMLAGMIAYYPHQEIPEMTLQQYRAEFKLQAETHGLANLREAFLATRRRPGQKFFPHPTDIAEVLEEMAKKAKQEVAKSLPKLGCSLCLSPDASGFAGLIVKQQPGRPRYVEPCECRLARERAKKAAEVGA
jgi:hypothetical protein